MSNEARELRFVPISGIPIVSPGDDLPGSILDAAKRSGLELRDGVLLVCQKVVSKAEGRIVRLDEIEPSDQARRIAAEDGKDPRHIEVILRETRRIVRRGHGVLICETHHGFVCANAGVDLSNSPGADIAVLLPEDCDTSAKRLREALIKKGCEAVAVIITDTFGRPWREGLVDQAVGSAGVAPIDDQRGAADLSGRELQVTATALVDQLAAAAGILMRKDSGIAAVWVDGLSPRGDGTVREILRDSAQDLFR